MDINLNEYQHIAKQTLSDKLKENKEELIKYCCLGLSGETGELIDAIKKWMYHNKPFNEEHLISECGDVLWYLSVLLDTLGFSLDKVAKANVEKLEKRHGSSYNSKGYY